MTGSMRAHPGAESQPSERRLTVGTHFPHPSLVSPARTLPHSARTHALACFSLAPSHQVHVFLLFLLYFHALSADSVRMYKTLILSTLLLSLDIIGLSEFALQPEAVVFAALGFATLPFFISAALAIRGE